MLIFFLWGDVNFDVSRGFGADLQPAESPTVRHLGLCPGLR